MHRRSQHAVLFGRGAVVDNRNDGNADIFLKGFEDRLADQAGAAEDRVDVHEQADIGVMFEQAQDLEHVLRRFTLVLKLQVVFL